MEAAMSSLDRAHLINFATVGNILAGRVEPTSPPHASGHSLGLQWVQLQVVPNERISIMALSYALCMCSNGLVGRRQLDPAARPGPWRL